jgi:acetylornithine/N-succinyldiaminopimelate aminotransferase
MSSATLPVLDSATAPAARADSFVPVYRRGPTEFVRGAGMHLYDADGRSWIDFTSGIGVNALGHADAGVATVIRKALDSGLIHISNLYHNAPARALADALVAAAPFASAVFLCNSGAEANEGAFKFARRWAREVGSEEKTGIVSLRGAFHGRLFASLAATDRVAYRAPFLPLVDGVTIAERDLRALSELLDGERIAAVIAEPVQGEGGVRVLDPSFLHALRVITRERRIALILDEVQCGLGRTGHLFAHQAAGVEPDMLTLAKPLAGGLPMGAILVSEEISACMNAGDHGTTFGGGPLVSSVALHVLERLGDPGMLATVRANGAWLHQELERLGAATGRIRAVRGAGYMWGADVMDPASQIVTRAFDRGLLLCSAGEHTLRLLPPLIATRDDLAHGLSILGEILHG